MKYKLPIIFGFFILLCSLFSGNVFAQSTSKVTPSSNNGATNIRIAEDPPSLGEMPNPGDWVSDPTVTFVGKTANRSGDFLDWTLRNYDWACVARSANGCSNSNNPLAAYWLMVSYVIYALLIGVVLVAAFIMIISRGQNVAITRFIPRFIFIIILIALSYSLIQFIYIIVDVIQGFFLKSAPNLFDLDATKELISTRDLIFIGFDYKGFEGFRRYGSQFDEAAFMTLLLVRLTALTYYVMTGILLIRKIILWFFIILSPVFPLLLFFRPIRNTGKIWIGEFFRWLLYAPLFAIFLHGLVVLWRSQKGIPLAFDFASSGRVPGVEADIVYPTAVNILIGGPGQKIGQFNSVNLQDTFALYVVALLMLWVVIILPFLLLKIFLDYLGTISFQENTTMKRLLDRGSSFLPIGRPPTSPPVSPMPPPQGAGRALQMPIGTTRTVSESSSNMINRNVQNIATIPVNAQILQLANLSIPKMRDIAKFETSMVSRNTSRMQDVSRLKTSLSRISNPTNVTSVTERERYTQVKQQLISEKQKGNVLASSILSAAGTTSAPSGMATHKVPGKVASLQDVHLPQVNRVQEVSIEDYEEVRKMWTDTYQSSTPPGDPTGKVESREEWIKGDIDKINQAITLLNSVDPLRNKEGMDMVSNILPFLMIGGFSRTEVVAYLKAKLEAAKSVLANDTQKKEDEDTMVDRKETSTTAAKHMSTHTEAELPTAEDGAKKLEDLRKSGM